MKELEELEEAIEKEEERSSTRREETAEGRYLNKLKKKKAELEGKKRIMLLELKALTSLVEKYIELAEEGLDVKDKIRDTGQDIAMRLGLQCSIDEQNSIWDLEKQIRETMQETRRMEEYFLAEEEEKK